MSHENDNSPVQMAEKGRSSLFAIPGSKMENNQKQAVGSIDKNHPFLNQGVPT